jgi:hypothetical protein
LHGCFIQISFLPDSVFAPVDKREIERRCPGLALVNMGLAAEQSQYWNRVTASLYTSGEPVLFSAEEPNGPFRSTDTLTEANVPTLHRFSNTPGNPVIGNNAESQRSQV